MSGPGVCEPKPDLPPVTFQDPAHDSIILLFSEKLTHQDYASADSLLRNSLPPGSATQHYFLGLLNAAVFDDYGDTSALSQARFDWEQLQKILQKQQNEPALPKKLRSLYLGLADFQLSYIYARQGKLLSAAMSARSGDKILKKVPEYIEAQCVVTIYAYYKERLFSKFNWLPFFEADPDKQRLFLQTHAAHSRYLYPIFLTPLIWMHFDKGQYEEGLRLTESFLKKFPENRIFRSMEADFHYKLGDMQKAADLFEILKQEYADIYTRKPGRKFIKINYYSVAGNLVRVYDALGEKNARDENSEIWFSQDCINIRPWLPKSLVTDLERFERKAP